MQSYISLNRWITSIILIDRIKLYTKNTLHLQKKTNRKLLNLYLFINAAAQSGNYILFVLIALHLNCYRLMFYCQHCDFFSFDIFFSFLVLKMCIVSSSVAFISTLFYFYLFLTLTLKKYFFNHQFCLLRCLQYTKSRFCIILFLLFTFVLLLLYLFI